MASIITAANNGQSVQLHVGAEAMLRLHENPASGYRWAVDPYDENLVEMTAAGLQPSPGAIGSGGESHWMLHARSTGVARIRLKRWRPWEGERSVTERFEIALHIVP